ncbi:hypothetical protein G6666_07510 [Polynucleobacter paneuropaeus]|nr:hypothetical protein [Polynucleobacter paneuropaeus]
MKLYSNWKTIIRKGWSIRFMLVAGALSGFEVALPVFADQIPRGTFATLSFLAVGGAFISRLVAQEGL